jgi:uncharacterized protein YukE
MSIEKIVQAGDALVRRLDDANRRLKHDFEKLRAEEDALRADWDDEMGREFRAKWAPFAEDMTRYLHKVGPEYFEEMSERLRSLKEYLYGTRS